MNNVVRFESVSKRYDLGVTRTSLLRLLSNRVKRVFAPTTQNDNDQKTLWALRDISFELKPGQSLGVIGKNGAGKSTLLKLLANITHPTSGRIDVSGRMSALLELGTGFHGDLTGRENVYLNGIIMGLSRRDVHRHFEEIVAFSEIDRFIDTPVKRYSSGMLVRLGFAVAACIEPELLIVDEVLAVGDASFRQKCLERIQVLIDKGTSIIFVSHNLSMVQAICPTSLYLVKGKIRRSGETKDMINLYERDLLEERARKFDKSDLRKIETRTEVEITHLEILSVGGSNSKEFATNQPVEVRMQYAADYSSQRANAVVRIVRTDGLTCCMLRTELDDFRLSLHEGGGIVSLRIEPLQLITGTYVIEAVILNESASLILASKMSETFFVSGTSQGYDQYFGVFEPHRSWAHESLEGADTSENLAQSRSITWVD